MKTIFLAFCFLSLSSITYGQSLSPTVISSSGGYFSNSSASLSWTFGETVVDYVSNGNNSLSQGFQQTYGITTAISEPITTGFSIYAFPNPANNVLHLEIAGTGPALYHAYLIDMLGRVQIQKDISGSGRIITELSLENIAMGMYFLHIVTSGKEVKTLKIAHLN